MSTISLSLAGMTAGTTVASLVITNLTDGEVRPGDTVEALLSTGGPIDTYAWGSTPGGNEYASTASLVVPQAAVGSTVYVTVQAAGQTFAQSISVVAVPVQQSSIVPGPSRIDVNVLAAVQPLSNLTASAGPSLIFVENA